MSRRQLIRNAGIAGAAAWTAPVILDSVTSAALGATGSCPPGRYFMKLVGRGTDAPNPPYQVGDCYPASPGCNNTTAFNTGGNSPNSRDCTTNTGYEWVCTGGDGHNDKFRSSFANNANSYTVVLAANCSFSNETTYMAVGNYGFNDGNGWCSAVAPSTANSVTFPKVINIGGQNRTLDYMYFEFVCT